MQRAETFGWGPDIFFFGGSFFSRGDCKSKDAKFTLKPGFYEIADYNNCMFSLISLYKVENKKDMSRLRPESKVGHREM